MDEIIKTCKKHGDLTLDGLIKSGKNKDGTQRFRCKKCMKEIHHANYLKNKEHIITKSEEYKKNNPDKVKQWRKNDYEKFKYIRNNPSEIPVLKFKNEKDLKKFRIARSKLSHLLWNINKVIKKNEHKKY